MGLCTKLNTKVQLNTMNLTFSGFQFTHTLNEIGSEKNRSDIQQPTQDNYGDLMKQTVSSHLVSTLHLPVPCDSLLPLYPGHEYLKATFQSFYRASKRRYCVHPIMHCFRCDGIFFIQVVNVMWSRYLRHQNSLHYPTG